VFNLNFTLVAVVFVRYIAPLMVGKIASS